MTMPTETIIPQIDVSGVLGDQTECVRRLRPMCEAADVLPNFPMATTTVEEVLRSGGGYDIDAETLNTWARTKTVQGLRIAGGQFSWSPQAVSHAAVLCELFRRWLPLHGLHVHKMTGAELAQAQAVAVGECLFTDLNEVTNRDLVVMMSRSDDPNVRNILSVALLAKLEKAGVLK